MLADEAILNIVHQKKKTKISPLYKYVHIVQCQSATVHGRIGKIYIQYRVARHAVLVCNYYLTVFSSFLPAKRIGVI